MSQSWDVLPGGLSAADHEKIRELADKGWKSSRIAQSIRKNSGTVYWFMLRDDLVERAVGKVQKPAAPYKRGNHWVYPYGREEMLSSKGCAPRASASGRSPRARPGASAPRATTTASSCG